MRDGEQNLLGMTLTGLILLLIGLALFCYHLGKADLSTHSEAAIANAALTMNQQGSWLITSDASPAVSKMPSIHLWAVKLSANLDDEQVSSFETRLPSAISAIAILLVIGVWFLGHARAHNMDEERLPLAEGFTLLAGLLLATTPLFSTEARSASSVMMLAFFHTLASYCFGQSLEARRSFYAGRPWRTWMLWGYLAAIGGVLTVGPLALLLLWWPYWLSTRSYHLKKRPDWIHGAGTLLAVFLGLWLSFNWLRGQEGSALEILRCYLGQAFSADPLQGIGLGGLLTRFFLYTLPWSLPALAMIVRVWTKKDRSPTLVYWMWSVVGNFLLLIVFSLLGVDVRHGLVLLVPFMALMAADGFYRWNCDSRSAYEWRGVMMVILPVIIIAGAAASTLLHSRLGAAMFGLVLIISCVWWLARRRDLQTASWRSTLRLTVMVMLSITAFGIMLVSDWEQRRDYYNSDVRFYRRVQQLLDEDKPQQFYAYRPQAQALDQYYTGAPVTALNSLDALPESGGEDYLFSEGDLQTLMAHPRLVPMTTENGCNTACDDSPAQGLFKILSKDDLPTTFTVLDRMSYRPPVRIVVMGNSGTGRSSARRVGKRLDSIGKRQTIDDALLLGNNLCGPRVYNHLGFIKRFEYPFRRTLRRGVEFHALLGHEDQSYAFVQTRYPLFNMNSERYYKVTLGEGLIDCFMLDTEGMQLSDTSDEQFEWLKRELAASTAPWKMIGLHRALFSAADAARPDGDLARRLLPIVDEHNVDLVAWSGGYWYERLELPETQAIFLNAGWSGDKRETDFDESDVRLRSSCEDTAGFIMLEVRPLRLRIQAITTNGDVVDTTEILRPVKL